MVYWKHKAQPLAFKPCVTKAVPCFSWHLKERDKRTQKERRVREQKKRENTHFGSREIREKRWTATLITDPNHSDWDQWNLMQSRQGWWATKLAWLACCQKCSKLLLVESFQRASLSVIKAKNVHTWDMIIHKIKKRFLWLLLGNIEKVCLYLGN